PRRADPQPTRGHRRDRRLPPLHRRRRRRRLRAGRNPARQTGLVPGQPGSTRGAIEAPVRPLRCLVLSLQTPQPGVWFLMSLNLIATAAFGLEAVVARELKALGYTEQTI